MIRAIERMQERMLMRTTLRRWGSDPELDRRWQRVLALDASKFGKHAPRALPGHPELVASGWSEHMRLRYLLAMEHAQGSDVLDSCCGLGWGTYLLAGVAHRVTGIDIDAEAVRSCERQWGDVASFVEGSVLELPFDDASFDVVTCMEAIEHFTLDDGHRYLRELARVCRTGGVIVGSSAFPRTRGAATRLCSTNDHHLHIYTRREMRRLLEAHFGPPTRLTRHYFVARRH